MVAGRLRRRLASVPVLTRWVGVSFAVGTALMGGAFGVLPTVIADDPSAREFRPLVTCLVVFVVSGLSSLGLGVRLWRQREQVLDRRGTAYIIEERAAGWTYEEKSAFIADVRTHYPRVLLVPGPGSLDGEWSWPLGRGAELWDSKVDELVRAFWTLRYNDRHAAAGGVFIWAWWSVGLSFAARATTGRRESTLRVRHRPSVGRQGRLDLEAWHEEPHTFLDHGQVPASLPETRRRVMLKPRTPNAAIGTGTSIASRWLHSLTHRRRLPAPARLLLVRMTNTTFGADLRPDTPPAADTLLEIEDCAGVVRLDGVEVEMLELQLLPPAGVFHAWSEFPALAHAAATWVARNTADVNGPVLLGVLAPQEISVGMGIVAGKLAGGRSAASWPEHLWPLHPHHDGSGCLVLPRLDLGRGPLSRTAP